MTEQEKWDRGRTLLLESLLKPDTKLRGCAYNQECYNQLMVIREEVIGYVKQMKNPHIEISPTAEISNAMLSSHVGQYFMNQSYKSSELDNPENASEYD